MGKVKEQQQKVFDDCYAIYEKSGYAAVINHVSKQQNEVKNPAYIDVKYERCKACDNEMPSLGGVCLICGQAVDFEIPILNSKPLYFKIVAQGWNAELQREEIQIHCGENGNLFIIKTDEGFIVDVYNQDDNVDTMTVWEDDLTPVVDENNDDLPEESYDPTNFSMTEVIDFVDEYGKFDDEFDVNSIGNAGYYFQDKESTKWLLIHNPAYTPREQAIADYLRVK